MISAKTMNLKSLYRYASLLSYIYIYIKLTHKTKHLFFLKIDDHQIMTMSVKELNTLLKSMKPNDAANIKRRRRILKNKGYAASSRHRQTSMVGNLSVERSQLVRQVRLLFFAEIFVFIFISTRSINCNTRMNHYHKNYEVGNNDILIFNY